MSALGVGDFIERVTEDSQDIESSMALFFAVYALFICFTLIILMNILIAMLSNRYVDPDSIFKKGKVLPYSLPSVGPGADPDVKAVSHAGDFKPSTRR